MKRTWSALLALALFACSSYSAHRRAQIAEQTGDWDQAVLYYLDLLEQDPGNTQYRAALTNAKVRASQEHFALGKSFRDAGDLNRALVEFRQAVELDPTNQYAFVELGKVREEIQARAESRDVPPDVDEMKRRARKRSQPPVLNPRSQEPISLNFPKPVSVQDIYRAVGKAYGINTLFDPNLKDQEIAIELVDVVAQDALEILMRAAGHFYKVLDEHTVLIAADTPQNRRNYEDLVIQTFFLSNAEVKDVMTMLRSLVDAKKIASNEQLNAIILRDTADRVRVADRLIQTNDKARAEVVVEVELILMGSQALQDLGMSLSEYSITAGLDTGGEGVPLRVGDLQYLNQNSWTLSFPSFIYTFIKQNTDAQVLAQPQLRISEGEKATLHIGDRVPIPSTTFNTANTIGSNIVPVTSFQYTDIGIKVDVEPRVHHNLEVSLKLKVEISNISGSVPGANGQEQPIIGTRNIETVIRLKDGETNFLAGLIRTDETTSEQGIPGLSDIPVLGRLFTKKKNDVQRTDVLLTLTPHIIRKSDITEEDLLPIWVGTETNISFRGGSPRVESDVQGPFDEEGESAADRVREMLRRRVRELPSGVQDDGSGEPQEERQEEEPPPGVELVPSVLPSDPFRGSEEPEEPEEPEEDSGNADLDLFFRQDYRWSTPASTVEMASSEGDERIRIRVLPQRLTILPGDSFELVLEARSPVPVSHLPATLAFDPEVLEFRGAEPGDFLGGLGEAEVLTHTSAPGTVLLGASRLGRRPGVTGDGTLLRCRFRALAPGATTVSVESAEALDSRLRSLGKIRRRDAEITVTTGASPEPPGPPEIYES